MQDFLGNIQVIVGGFIVCGSIAIYLSSTTFEARAKRAGAKLPPGPKKSFLVGNLFNFPRTRWYENFTEWQKEYGE